jgi:hypothetical protein
MSAQAVACTGSEKHVLTPENMISGEARIGGKRRWTFLSDDDEVDEVAKWRGR